MTAYRDRPGSALSYGQRKLVELAQVLALETRVILLGRAGRRHQPHARSSGWAS